ncbi:MAG: isoleucine--tRNA ligase [Acidimicrobiales bacterium]
MPFGPVDAQLDFTALEARVLDRWRESDLMAQVQALRAGQPRWIFYEGPPTANGRPGLHHVWARVFKDLYPRFQTMRGHDVPRKGGWDCHGLPVEIAVEKELGLADKRDTEAYGIARFNERCRESVQRHVQEFTALTERAAVWIDTRDAYWTLHNDYIESVWWLIRQLWDRDLLYEGHRVSPYCARCGTALSSHEVAQGYREVTDISVFVRFPLLDDDADLLVWTTTPWTLISNVAVAAGPDIDYVRVNLGDGRRDVIVAEALMGGIAAADVAVLERYSGRQLEGRRYRRPFELLELAEGPRVVTASYVSIEEGAGLVHLAPAFGAEDMEVAQTEGLAVLNPVGPDGTFEASVAPWTGRFVKDADPDIVEDLRARGLLVATRPYLHAYPHCWRCGTPLIYWAKTSWFARTSARKADLVEQNELIGWHPEHIRHGRFGDWLENNVDWALSRDRYWGTPLPIWRCSESHDTCVGSVSELADLAGTDLTGLDLHRPFVDEVVIVCPSPGCGRTARRLPPVVDAWFDSGAMPTAQHHHPFEDGQIADSPSEFPADFICEAIDQTRGWFYSLLAVNTLVFGRSPYRNVVCLAHVVDEHGQKMSKSKDNVINPWDIFERFGADALRWYFFSAGSPWTSRRIFEEGIREAARKTLVTLWNVFSFFATYADLDGWVPGSGSGKADRELPSHILDRWVLGELDRTVETVTAALEAFDSLEAATRLAAFVDDLSNWYVRRSRARFWKSSDLFAHRTLHRCLSVTAQLLAPFCPLLADEIWTTLTGEPSVHLSDWPAVEGSDREAAKGSDRAADLAREMSAARRLVGLGRSARTEARVRTRQPLGRALLLHPDVGLSPEVRAEIAEELNVRAVEDVDSLSGLISWTVVPNFRALGPRLGSGVNEVKAALASADGSELRRSLDAQGWVEVAGHRLGPDDVEVRAERHADFALAQDGAWAVALDLELDDDLRAEGAAREMVRALNDLRKALRFELSDRIELRLDADRAPRAAAALASHRDWIAGEVLATALVEGGVSSDAHTLELDGEFVLAELTRTS